MKLEGTWQLWFFTNIWDSNEILLALVLDNPHGLIIFWILIVGITAIDLGLFAKLNNFGVTWLTLSSVHWALSNTEINNSKWFEWFKGFGVSG